MKTVEPVSCTNQGSEQRAYLAFPFHKSTQMRCLISRSSCSIYDNGFIVCRRRKNKSRKTGGFILEDDFASSIRGIILERNLRRKYEKIGNVVVSSERGAGSNGWPQDVGSRLKLADLDSIGSPTEKPLFVKYSAASLVVQSFVLMRM